MTVRDDLINRLQERSQKYCIDHKISFKDHTLTCESLENATLEQLWTLYDKFSNAPSFCLYAYDPKRSCDYLAMDLCGTYIGIEQDGYAHS